MIPPCVVALRAADPADSTLMAAVIRQCHDYFAHLVDKQIENYDRAPLARKVVNGRKRRKVEAGLRRAGASDDSRDTNDAIEDEITDLRQALWIAVDTAIRRLKYNDKSTPDEIDRYVVNEIQSERLAYFRENRSDLYVPASTNTTRKVKYKTLRRGETVDETDGGHDDDEPYKADRTSWEPASQLNTMPRDPMVVSGESGPYVPSRLTESYSESDPSVEGMELLRDFTDLQLQAINLMWEGHTSQSVATILGISEYQVEKIRQELKDRAKVAGYKVPADRPRKNVA